MAKPDLGIKRVCPSCGARFYDLQKRPIECPKCAFTFEPEALVKQRRPRVVEAPPAPAPVPVEAEAEAETEEAEESVEAMAEAEHAEAEEEEAAEAEAAEEPVVAPAEPVAGKPEEFEEEVEEEEEEQDDSLLAEVEEEEDDVSGIIDTDIGKEEP